MDDVNSPYVAALWDLHHPYRYANEQPHTTIENLGNYIKFVHAKDSVMIGGKCEYRLMGEEICLLMQCSPSLKNRLRRLYFARMGKKMGERLCDAGIVFPHFANFMEPYKKMAHTLFDSKDGKGKYIWKKERLIDETFPDVLDRVCKEFPNQYAFRYTEFDYTRTYPEFRDDVDTFARSLIAMGVKKGDHVAIWATNIPAWYITFWATTKIGAVLVTVNTAYKVHEAEYLLRQSDTQTLVMIDGYKDSNYIEIIKEICPELEECDPGDLKSKRLPVLKNVVTVDSKNNGCYTWDDAMKLAETVDISEVEKCV
ncbi:MAG: AMP-binding protein [Clostridiales bacterium]|nr:MAG: AMP-binding protein [Clostridiales bacterium]